MSELTATQTTELEQILIDRYRLLMEEVQQEMEHTGNIRFIEMMGHSPGDIGDESMADAVADLNLAMVDRQIQEMREIETARQRIKSGEYGFCIDCGAAIGYKRLLAYPTAKRCIVCQEKYERTYATENHPSL